MLYFASTVVQQKKGPLGTVVELVKQVGIPTKARAGFSLKGWFLRGRPLQGFDKHFRQDLTGLNKIRGVQINSDKSRQK